MMLLYLSGSVFPRALPAALFSSLIAAVFLWDLVPFELPNIDHPFAVQIYGVVLGYVIVFRTNMALNRYREGIHNVQLMTSKWGDAFMQINAFINASLEFADKDKEELLRAFRWRCLHWFSLLNAIAITLLNGKEVVLDEFEYRTLAVIQRRGKKQGQQVASSRGAMYLKAGAGGAEAGEEKKEAGIGQLRVIEYLTDEEAGMLDGSSDKTLVVSEWITEAITRMQVSGVLKTPPPILSRCYQEMSNGALGFNQAFKVALIPFPFPFAQILSILLLVFLFIAPIMIVKMTVGKVAVMLTFFAIMGYWGLNEIAVELENPFGDDENDLPLNQAHRGFVEALEDCALTNPVKIHIGFKNNLKDREKEKTQDKGESSSDESDDWGEQSSDSGGQEDNKIAETINDELKNIVADTPADLLFDLRLSNEELLSLTKKDLIVQMGDSVDLANFVHRRLRELAADELDQEQTRRMDELKETAKANVLDAKKVQIRFQSPIPQALDKRDGGGLSSKGLKKKVNFGAGPADSHETEEQSGNK